MSSQDLTPLYLTLQQQAQALTPSQDTLSNLATQVNLAQLYPALMAQQMNTQNQVQGYASGGPVVNLGPLSGAIDPDTLDLIRRIMASQPSAPSMPTTPLPAMSPPTYSGPAVAQPSPAPMPQAMSPAPATRPSPPINGSTGGSMVNPQALQGLQRLGVAPPQGLASGGIVNDVHPVNYDKNQLADYISKDKRIMKMFDVAPPPKPSPEDKKSIPDVLDEYNSEEGDRYLQQRQDLMGKAAGGLIDLHEAAHMAAGGLTEAQKKAGNYKKHHVKVHGMPISIENPAGSVRSGKDKDGKPWSVKMPVHYGYIKRTEGADGDHVDAFIGPHHDHPQVHVIDQVHPDTGKFDEHKVMMGFKTPGEALTAYHSSFSDGKGPQRAGAITPMHVDGFKHWVKHGDTKKPMVAHFAAGGHVQTVMHRFKKHVPDMNPLPRKHYRNSGVDDGTLSSLRTLFRSSPV